MEAILIFIIYIVGSLLAIIMYLYLTINDSNEITLADICFSIFAGLLSWIGFFIAIMIMGRDFVVYRKKKNDNKNYNDLYKELEKEIQLVKGDYEQVGVAWNNDFNYIAEHFFRHGLKYYCKDLK